MLLLLLLFLLHWYRHLARFPLSFSSFLSYAVAFIQSKLGWTASCTDTHASRIQQQLHRSFDFVWRNNSNNQKITSFYNNNKLLREQVIFSFFRKILNIYTCEVRVRETCVYFLHLNLNAYKFFFSFFISHSIQKRHTPCPQTNWIETSKRERLNEKKKKKHERNLSGILNIRNTFFQAASSETETETETKEREI